MSAVTYSDENLKVEPAAPEGWIFAAGDTIIGTVLRRSRLATPRATVRLFFWGKLKVIFHTYNSYGRSNTRCAVDKNIIMPKEGLLFEGLLHVQEGVDPYSWPFQVKIPSAPDYAVKTTSDYLSPFHGALCRGPLPASFVSTRRDCSCFIEYYLQAELCYTHTGGYPERCESTHLITIRRPHTAEFHGFASQGTKFERIMRGYHLLPDSRNDHLSFKQKKREFFGSSKLPQLDYGAEMTAPKTISLNNPSPMPIQIRCFLRSKTSSEIHDFPPEFWLPCKDINHIEIKSLGRRRPGSSHIQKGDLGLQQVLDNMSARDFKLEIPIGEKREPLDIGEVFQLSLYPHGLKSGGNPWNRKPKSDLTLMQPISNIYMHCLLRFQSLCPDRQRYCGGSILL
ncbi:hypothetical protein N7492_007418 [Penicillium capsulatum]|uniref:Arrestin-like N-terminal domain-containing protein n=1 Tax=Penicillium capsulatum TaxID=69766 RepID=A0A9W9I1Z4_9EURO|nr:hypothetical protein N7492_007418 [Penicillium capsulatum]KAJ6117254.1 hypothetical protein N7512_006979 [Penicillium capsulatum]